MHYFVSFLVCNHLEEEERAGCFAFIVLRMSCYCKCSVNLLVVPWIGLRCVIVVFPDHTHLLFNKQILNDVVNNIESTRISIMTSYL